MNIIHYIKLIIQEILPMNDLEESDSVNPEDRGPSEEDYAFGFIITGILLFILFFILLNLDKG